MSNSLPDEASLPLRPLHTSTTPATNMRQPDEQTKEPPQPAPSLQNRLASSYDYLDKPFRRFHQHSLSDLSGAGSTDSSPTTTISTVDDSSATEPSPGSSPESPPPATFAAGMLRPHTADDGRPFFELQKQLPPKKERNLKNLAVNTSRGPGRPYSSASLPLPTSTAENFPGDVATAFVKPSAHSKRKPSSLGLTLLTPGTGRAAPPEMKLAIPPTPGLSRPASLRHFQSSPSLPLSARFGPQDGEIHQFGVFSTTLATIRSPTQPHPARADDEEEQNFDVPLSQEAKPEAYPNGPISVYDPYIDLYLEPTIEEAREYDVIMNVASEVRNPFVDFAEPSAEEPQIRLDGGGGIQFAPKRENIQRRSAKLSAQSERSSSTEEDGAPISTAKNASAEPEYIHVKWEHNSDIVPDLLDLVKLIDERVMQRKRVLVHCQCGVSRSASLVVAYGLYKDPSLSVQEAYDLVKTRSKWIGPNMNLIMQLQEFRSSLMQGGLLSTNRGLTPITPSSAFQEWRGPFATASTTSSQSTVQPPLRASTPNQLPVRVSGPSSAPSEVTEMPLDSPPIQRLRAISAGKSSTPYVDPSGRVVPVVPVLQVAGPDENPHTFLTESPVDEQQPDSDSITPTAPSPVADEFAMTPLQPSPEVDPADSFGVMSPSTTEYSSSPFDRSALLAKLGMGSIGSPSDGAPRRSASLRSRGQISSHDNLNLTAEPRQAGRMRGKISSPDLREQRRLQDFQARIEAALPNREAQLADLASPLLSPRATEFTQNPFALAVASIASPPLPDNEHPAAQPSDSDPRSPPLKGGSPITRSIFDVL